MLNTLKIAALSLLLSAGVAFAATISGTSSIGGTYTSSTDPLAVGAAITLTANSITNTGDYDPDASIPAGIIDIVASTGANAGTAFSFPIFDFVIDSTTGAFFSFGTLLVGGLGTATGTGFDASPSSWRLAISGNGVGGAFTLFIETPPGDVPSSVPVPAGLPLLIGGLAMFGVLRKRAAT